MTDDLVKRLGFPMPEGVDEVTLPVWAIDLMGEALARIEALEREKGYLLERIMEHDDRAEAAEAAEARLAKAVEALTARRDDLRKNGYTTVHAITCGILTAVLAEIEGGKKDE